MIEYRVDGQADVIRLVTSLTDHEEYPAAELATLYARRWEIEIVFDEIKTHQRGRPVLRSQTPDGVRQEIYAHLIVHHATRDLLNDVARIAQTSAERTSFTRALHVVRRSVIMPCGSSPQPEIMTAFSASPRSAGPSYHDDAHATAPAN
ncbi:transposase [Streptomyces thinghirensis]|uniref:Transposase IS4-like domain-containing protein n=1 Tax=Streptomyces thinghirensis TaxID=551547 RepID=A0ABP9T4H6_9ACTN